MPTLSDRLGKQDLGFLQIIAELWGFDLVAPDARQALPMVLSHLSDPALVSEIVGALPRSTREALDAVVLNDGWLPWASFTRDFGELREVGPGRRDREKPYLDPISPAETLWYHALIGREFLKPEDSLLECVYIPEEFLDLLPPVLAHGPQPPGRPASPGETQWVNPAHDRILDHTCTLLAALRMGEPRRSPAAEGWQPPLSVVHAILAGMKLITSSEQPVPEDARPFLEMPRGEALAWLAQGWRESVHFNELRLLPSLICEGSWQNDPRAAREKILAFLSEIPEDTWWNLDAFVEAIYKQAPDFQRPGGDFDTWLVRDAVTDQSYQGFQHWDAVDGALIRFLITGPMHWLGMIDLAAADPISEIAAFRFSAWAPNLLMGLPVAGLGIEDHPFEAFSEGVLTASPLTPRLARYQISRFCLWTAESAERYTYQLTPASLRKAAEQGLKISHLETLLTKYGTPPPPSLIDALHHWDKRGGQVRINSCVVLRVNTPDILEALRGSSASRFLGDKLGPTAAIIHPGAANKVSAALARLGYLSDVELIAIESADAEDENG